MEKSFVYGSKDGRLSPGGNTNSDLRSESTVVNNFVGPVENDSCTTKSTIVHFVVNSTFLHHEFEYFS
jgi:hypothetical protein